MKKDELISVLLVHSLSSHRVVVRKRPVGESETVVEEDQVPCPAARGCAV